MRRIALAICFGLVAATLSRAQDMGTADAATIAFEQAELERIRPKADDDDEHQALVRAEALYTASLAGATGAVRAQRLEWRGNVRTRLFAVDASETDLLAAEAIYVELRDARGAARCLRRRATNAMAGGDALLGSALLERHQQALERLADPALLPEVRDSVHLSAVLAARLGDLDRAVKMFERQRALDESLQAGLSLTDMFAWSDRAQRFQSDLVLELAQYARRQPTDASRALELAEAVADHLQATALSTALRRFGAAKGPTAAPTSRTHADLAVMRLFRATPQDAPAELVLMFRAGDRFAFEVLGRCDAIDAEATAFCDEWFGPDGLSRCAADYARDAHALFARLFGSAASAFSSQAPPPRRLVVLVNGPLESVPFDALVTAPDAGGGAASFADLPYVVRHSSVLRLPALATLRAIPAPNEFERAIAVLDPALDDARLPPLPHARAEADALRAVHRDCVLLSGPQATLPRLLDALRREPTGWLHLACHAEWSEGRADRAILRLAPSGASDGRLGLERVIGQNDAFLLTPGIRVVLSGCGTARGPLRPGEGMLGLWRAFLFRGASCVVSTLRPVDDRAGAAWMTAFHRHAVREPAADAARAASLDWLRNDVRPRFPRGFAATDTAHPQLWAIAIVVGNDGGELP